MLHIYVKMYELCFMATVILIMALIAEGVEEEHDPEKPAVQMPTTKEWIGCILRAFLIAFVVSFAAPVVLVFYIFTIGCVIVEKITKD